MISRRRLTRRLLTVVLVLSLYFYCKDGPLLTTISRVLPGCYPSWLTSGITFDMEDERLDPTPMLKKLAGGNLEFDWNEWLDLRFAKQFETHQLDSDMYPIYDAYSTVEDVPMPFMSRANQHELQLAAKLYCKHYMPAPMRVIALGPPLSTEPPKVWTVTHAKEELRHRQYGAWAATSVEDMPLDVPSSPSRDLFVNVEPEDFKWEPTEMIAGDPKAPHAQTLKKALKVARTAAPHFQQPHIRNDIYGYGGHYDWRFFRGVANHEKHIAALHALARTWQTFADSMHINYWYAHGPLIGWHWTGFSLPWDLDLDIQMPIMELDRIARTFNRTLVVQDPSEGTRKYLIDIGPWYVDRRQSNFQNIIEGRFIDVDTGIYIDITGLAYTSDQHRNVSCKALHSYKLPDLIPARRTSFEGLPGYIPLNTDAVLNAEYKTWRKSDYSLWKYNQKARIWQIGYTCDEVPKKYTTNAIFYCYPKQPASEVAKCDEDLFGTCDKYVIAEARASANVTLAHQREMDLWRMIPLPKEPLAALINTYHPPFHLETEDFEPFTGLEYELSETDSVPAAMEERARAKQNAQASAAAAAAAAAEAAGAGDKSPVKSTAKSASASSKLPPSSSDTPPRSP